MKFSLGLLGILFFLSPAGVRKMTSVAPVMQTDCSKLKGLEKMICLANTFKASLNETQVAALQLPYTKENAARWSNFPQAATRPQRLGVSFSTLNPGQLAAAKALMATVLANGVSNEGFDELEGGLAADDFLGKSTGKEIFGSGNFLIAFLGTPSMTGVWELQYGGHHYAFANTYLDGKILGVTPSFRGVEPMSPVTANGKTFQPVEQERKAFASMIASLTGDAQSTAHLSTSFGDVLLGPGRDGQFPNAKQGLKVSSLTATQQKLVLDAIGLYVNDLSQDIATPLLARYKSELSETYIAYAGSGSMSAVNDYVRIDGPGFGLNIQPRRAGISLEPPTRTLFGAIIKWIMAENRVRL